MRKPFKPANRRQNSGSWRDYQTELQRKSKARRFPLRAAGIALVALLAIFGAQVLPRSGGASTPDVTDQAALPALSAPEITSKQDLRQLLDEQDFNNLTQTAIELPAGQQVLQAQTSLDADLQNYLLNKMDRENSRYIGIVVMEADTGRILAMAGFDKTDPSRNPCLSSDFPAASIFKMVTAASAVDQFGYTADSSMHFNGYKHTLYKRQLTDATNKYTNKVSFKDAFAQSVNPVFGKLGKLHLGKPLLEESAEAFGFNEPLNFELPLPPSHFEASDKPYHWAELASGFNRVTTISPLHGAVMASAVLNDGRMAAPSIVDRILGGDGEELYRWQPAWEQQAMSARASTVLSRMMEATITSGTGRKSFRGYQKDKVLSRLQIGGKTGSIGSRDHETRYDWFVGYAKERQGQGQLVISVMVAHEKYIGIRASQYARMAMTQYFRNPSHN